MPQASTADLSVGTATGTAILPIARVKKVIASDEDIGTVSAQSTFLITKAAELFIRYLSERGFVAAKTEAKPKKSLAYRDLANIIVRTDNLEFLSDVVPQTTTWRSHKERKNLEATSSPGNQPDELPRGQTRLELQNPRRQNHPAVSSGPSDHMVGSEASAAMTGSGLVFQHYTPNGTTKSELETEGKMKLDGDEFVGQ